MFLGIASIRTNDSGKDGHTVKKLIALFLAVAFVCASTVGCGGATTPASKPASPAGSGGSK
jgi:hypothetical protein